jgi:hypothetical protein
MNTQREMFDAWWDAAFHGVPMSDMEECVGWNAWQAAIAAGTIAFRCANCKHLYEEKVSLCDCMPAVQEWEKVVVIEAAPEKPNVTF